MLLTDQAKRPSIFQILETSEVKKKAQELGITIQSQDEIKSQISQQKQEFMSTFTKMKSEPKPEAAPYF